jgi:phosphopantetheinyl transferase (holo-ACP synthase)
MREKQAMASRIQSFLRQQHVQAALSRASSLARQWKVQETISKVPQLLQQWQVQEKIERFYQSSILPRLSKVSRDSNEEISRHLDGLIAQGLELKTTSDDREEGWKSMS